ncbi:MAG: HD family phosphohydrolase [Nitrospirales bacterium]|nr:MAG: HD family phosphohydrolase [Nitrospirales bacterium]
MAFILLTDFDDLRIGLYIKLECSWWRHPFTKNTFKIHSRKELATIRGIKNLKIYYDPNLSDPPVDDNIDEDLTPPIEIEQEEVDELLLDDIHDVAIESPIDEKAVTKEKEERRRRFHEHRQQLKKVENAYWRILGESKDIFKGVSEGKVKGLKQAETMVSNLGAVLADMNASMTLMDVVSSHGMSKGISYHALNVCILSMITGRTLGLSKEQLNDLALAALFHDIGQRFLPVKVKFEGSGIMTQVDPHTLPLHPAQGGELLQTFPDFPEASIEAVFQHHERLDGTGYPLGLKDKDISFLAKIIMVIDEFDDLCNAANPHVSMTPHEALSRLFKTNQEPSTRKFPIEIVLAMIQSISLFPPGTIVELNDGSYGIVTSINMNAPTKPLLLLYVADTPKHEAVVVDLAEEPSLFITKTIRPKDLPPKILEHLSPRRTAIFVHTNKKSELVQVHLKSKV